MSQFNPKTPTSQPFTHIENMMSSPQTNPVKTPLKTRAISSHMAQKQNIYSQPCTTIIYSPLKQTITNSLNPSLELRKSLQQNISPVKNEEIDFVYRLQNEKMSQILKEKEICIYELKNKLKEFENEKEQNFNTLKNLEQKINDVLNENQKLNALLAEKEEFPQNSDGNLGKWIAENSKLSKLVEENQKIIEKQQNELINLTIKYEEKLKESEVFHDLIIKSEALIIENEKLNTYNKNKQKEIEMWKNRFLELEKSVNEFMQNNKKDEVFTKNDNLHNSNYSENFNYIETLTNKLKETESKLILIMEENKKLNKFFDVFRLEQEEKLLKKHYENDILKQEKEELLKKLNEKQNEVKSFESLKEKMNILIAENHKLNKILNEKVTIPPPKANTDYQQQMIDLQDKLEIMIEENEKLNAILEEKNTKIENHGNLEEFLLINEKLTKALKEKNQESEMWKRKFFDTQKNN